MSTRSGHPRRLGRAAGIALVAVGVSLLASCGGTPSGSSAEDGAAPATPSGVTAGTSPGDAAAPTSQPADPPAPDPAAAAPGATAAPDPIDRRIASMSLRDKIRQLVVLNFGGTRAPTDLIRRLHPGALIYFAPNLTGTRQIRAMSRRAQRAARRTGQPLLIMTDQEGGTVTRLPGTNDVPGGAEFDGNDRWARRTAVRTGHALTDVGVNVDLAPVADVNTVGARGVIGTRSFSSDPQVAARMVRAQVCGYHRGGVAATVKHFPGHGSTTTDSHLAPAQIRESGPRWRRTDLPPFSRAVHSGVDLVLLGHLSFPAMDPSGRPATISPRLDRRLLRHRVGFDGVVVTDSLSMRGITSYGSTGYIAVQALRSGVDLLLMPPDPPAAIHAVASAVHRGTLSEGRINVSVRRMLELKQRLGLYRVAQHLHQCG